MVQAFKYFAKNLSLFFFVFLIIFTIDRHHWYQVASKPEMGPFESDVAVYYSYLPAFFYGTPQELASICKENRYTIGMAIMYSPAFFVGDIIARQSGEKVDGYSKPYQRAIRWGSVIFAFVGLWFARKNLLMFFSDTVTLIALACVFFGTNLFYYTFSTGEMSHSYLFFFYSVFVYCSIKFVLEDNYKYLVWMGLLGGMMVLIRPTSVLLFLFPVLFKVSSFSDIKDRLALFFKPRAQLLMGLVLFMIPIVLQMLVWKKYHGAYVYYSYGDERFFFSDPQIINFLFSYRKGWLLYTPIMIFSLLGILLSRKYLNDLFWFLILFIPLNIYILSCWWDWGYGGSFGCRALIESYAVLIFPFALFVKWCFSLSMKYPVGKIAIKGALLIVLFLLIQFNIFQVWQYKNLIIHWAGMNERAYKHVFLRSSLNYGELQYVHDSLIIDVDIMKRRKGIRDD